MREGLGYGYGVQIISSSDIATIAPSMNNMDRLNLTWNEYVCYRPVLDVDNESRVLESFDVATSAKKSNNKIIMAIEDIMEPDDSDSDSYESDLLMENISNSFEFINWYLIPVDSKGNEINEIPDESKYNLATTPAAQLEYWFTNEQLEADGETVISSALLNAFVYTARQFNMPDFKIVFNDSEEPILYAFGGALQDVQTLVKGKTQIISNADLFDLIDIESRGYTASDIEYLQDEASHPYYYWTVIENTSEEPQDDNVAFYYYNPWDNFNTYLLIPLDEEGNDDLRLFK